MAGQVDVAITIGLPWEFLVFDLVDTEASPLKIVGLILDLLIYLVAAYLIDVIINIFFGGSLFKKKDNKKVPQQYELQKKKTLAEKATEKIVKKVETKETL